MTDFGVFSDFDFSSLYPPMFGARTPIPTLSETDRFIRRCQDLISNKGAKNRRRAILNLAMSRYVKTFRPSKSSRKIILEFIHNKDKYIKACEHMSKLRSDLGCIDIGVDFAKGPSSVSLYGLNKNEGCQPETTQSYAERIENEERIQMFLSSKCRDVGDIVEACPPTGFLSYDLKTSERITETGKDHVRKAEEVFNEISREMPDKILGGEKIMYPVTTIIKLSDD